MRSLRNLFLVQMDKEDKFQAFTFSLSSSAAKSLAISALSSKFSMSMSSSAMLFVPLFPRMGAGASFFPELPHLSQTYFCCHFAQNLKKCKHLNFLQSFFSPQSVFSSSFFLSHKIFFTPCKGLRDMQTRPEHVLLLHEKYIVVGTGLSQKTMEKLRGWSVCGGFAVLSMPAKTKPWTLFSVAVSADEGVEDI